MRPNDKIVITNEKAVSSRFLSSGKTAKHSYRVDEFIPRYRSMGILTPVVRYVSIEVGRSRFIVERPPTKVTVTYFPGSKREARAVNNAKKYTIPLPWQRYYMQFLENNRYCSMPFFVMAVADSPMTEEDAQKFPRYYPLPNHLQGGHVCHAEESLNEISKLLRDPNVTYAEVLYMAISTFWATGFNENAGAILTRRPDEWPRCDQIEDVFDWLNTKEIDDALSWKYKLFPRETEAALLDFFNRKSSWEPSHIQKFHSWVRTKKNI